MEQELTLLKVFKQVFKTGVGLGGLDWDDPALSRRLDYVIS